MFFYIPTTSLNFNSFFATESISPKSFYNARNFGTNRHFTTELNINDDFITLYKSIPYFDLLDNNSSRLEQYPIIIRIDVPMNDYNLIKLDDSIYLYARTLYFSNKNTKVLFLSKDHMEKVIGKSLVVSETKMVNNYLNNFKIINKEKFKKIEDVNNIKEQYRTIQNHFKEIEIEKDRIFDSIKGFYFSSLYKNEKLFCKNKNLIYNNEIINQIGNSMIFVKNSKSKSKNKIYKQLKNITRNLVLESKTCRKLKKDKLVIEPLKLNDFKFNPTLIFSFQNEDDKKVFNIIINVLIKSPKPRLGSFSKEQLEEILTNLGININNTFGANSVYRNDLANIYNRFIKGRLGLDISEIKSSVLQNFYAVILKRDNLKELSMLLNDENIENTHIAYSLLGFIEGFGDLNKLIVKSNSNILINDLFIELNQMKKKLWSIEQGKNVYKKDIYTLIGQLKKQESIEKVSKNLKKLNENGLKIKFNNLGAFLKISIEYNKVAYYINLYNKQYKNLVKNYNKQLKELGINKFLSLGKYRYFTYYKVEKKKKYLDLNEEKEFLSLLNYIFNSI